MEQKEEEHRLLSLLDSDPENAILEAHKFASDNINTQIFKAKIFVDAGSLVGDLEAVDIGVGIFRYVLDLFPDNPVLHYNLANGLLAHARITEGNYLSSSKKTESYRKEARNLFYFSANMSTADMDIKSQAFTNLGDILFRSCRWVEAYDFYMLALSENMANGIAGYGAIRMLRHSIYQKIGDEDFLHEEIQYLAGDIQRYSDCMATYAGQSGKNGILADIERIPKKERPLSEKTKDKYFEFVFENNLTLSPTISAHKYDSNHWDDLYVNSIVSCVSDGYVVPEVFSMFNLIKSDYVLARQILYSSINGKFKEYGKYNDTMDGALYGVNESGLLLSQRASFDILDKIAVATLSYLNVGNARRADFKNSWFKKDNSKRENKERKKELIPEVNEEVNLGNDALFALIEISTDVHGESGFLGCRQSARNSSTHRFSVIHDNNMSFRSKSECVEHYSYEDFTHNAIFTLKLARSAIVYFVQMISLRENRLQEDVLAFPTKLAPYLNIKRK